MIRIPITGLKIRLLHTEKSFFSNLVKLNQTLILITFFQFFWHHKKQMSFEIRFEAKSIGKNVITVQNRLNLPRF